MFKAFKAVLAISLVLSMFAFNAEASDLGEAVKSFIDALPQGDDSGDDNDSGDE